MKVEVLVATMHQADHSLLERMNIQTDAIVGNQCDKNCVEDFTHNGHNVKWLSFAERGVGLNRNNTLMRARGDVCLFADDDMVYYDGYEQVVRNAFEENEDADVIVFNIDDEEQDRSKNTKKVRVKKYNFGRYGAVRISFRRESVFLNGISFNLMFGGGARFSAGEDTLFLKDCLRCGLKVIAVPYSLAKLTAGRESTWFKGYDDKYFIDRGILNYFIDKRKAKLLCLYHALRHRKLYAEYGWRKAYKKMKEGIKQVKEKQTKSSVLLDE